MKKLLSLLLLVAPCMCWAQMDEEEGVMGDMMEAEVPGEHYIGEYMEIGGVPGFVYYLSENKQHGLVMSCAAFTEKDLKKTDKLVEAGTLTQEQVNKLSENYYGKEGIAKIKYKEVYGPLVGKLSKNGKENIKIIEDFCAEKGYSLAQYFPMQYWAKQLGEGWYIPGFDDLVLFINLYTGGRAKQITGFSKRAKELSQDPRVQAFIADVATNGAYSSFITVQNKHGFDRMLHMKAQKATSGFGLIGMAASLAIKDKEWLEVYTNTGLGTPKVVAIHEF